MVPEVVFWGTRPADCFLHKNTESIAAKSATTQAMTIPAIAPPESPDDLFLRTMLPKLETSELFVHNKGLPPVVIL